MKGMLEIFLDFLGGSLYFSTIAFVACCCIFFVCKLMLPEEDKRVDLIAMMIAVSFAVLAFSFFGCAATAFFIEQMWGGCL